MRRLFSFNMVTLDGYFEGPNQSIDWHNVDEEFNDFAIKQLNTIDLIMFGRITYQGMAGYWPTPLAIEDDPAVAEMMNRVSKVVFSRTLDRADWENTRLIKDNAADEVLKLKEQPGRDMAIFGSANLISTLMDVIDEHRVIVNPILLGRGTPFFKRGGEPIKLKMINVRPFNSGNVLLSYEPVRR